MIRIRRGFSPFRAAGRLAGVALAVWFLSPAWGQFENPSPALAESSRRGFADDDPVDSEIEFHRQLFQTLEEQAEAPAMQPELQQDEGPNEPLPPADTCPPRQRMWNLTLLLASEYDDNLRAAPQIQGLGAIRNRDDGRFVAALFGEVQPLGGENWGAGAIFSTFNGFQYEQNAFDLEDYMGGAYANGAWEAWMGAIRYEYHNTSLGHDHIADDHRLTPSLSYLGFDWGHTTVFYEFDTALLNAPALIPAQIQSGDVNAVGATQAFYTFDRLGRVYAGYRFENADAEGADFSRRTNMATARLEQPLWRAWFFDAEARHFWDDYKHPNSLDFWDRARHDRRLEVRSGLQKNLTTQVTLRFDYTLISTWSNVENLFGVRFFEYDRNLFSTQMIYTF